MIRLFKQAPAGEDCVHCAVGSLSDGAHIPKEQPAQMQILSEFFTILEILRLMELYSALYSYFIQNFTHVSSLIILSTSLYLNLRRGVLPPNDSDYQV